MGCRQDAIFAAPDHQNRHWQLVQTLAQDDGLLPLRTELSRDASQSCLNAIEPLVSENIFDELSSDQLRVGKQSLEKRLEVLSATGGDKPIKISAVDLPSQPRACNQYQRGYALVMSQAQTPRLPPLPLNDRPDELWPRPIESMNSSNDLGKLTSDSRFGPASKTRHARANPGHRPCDFRPALHG